MVEPILNILNKQVLRFCKDIAKVFSLPLVKITTKSTHFLPPKKKIPILRIELQTNKIQSLKTLHQTTSGKTFANFKDFFEKCELRSNIIFQIISYFLLRSSFLSIYLHKLMQKK